MARITSQICRKQVKCNKCGRMIEIGEKYLKAIPYRRSAIIRCATCGLKHYETSGSAYVQAVGRIIEDWENDYGVNADTPSMIADDLQSILDDCQDSLDNMPEQLQESSPLNDRIDALNDTINELENMDDWDAYLENNDGNEEEAEAEFVDAINDYLNCLEY